MWSRTFIPRPWGGPSKKTTMYAKPFFHYANTFFSQFIPSPPAICTHLAPTINSRLMAVASPARVLSTLTNKLNWSDLHTRPSPPPYYIREKKVSFIIRAVNKSLPATILFPIVQISIVLSPLFFLSFLFVVPLTVVYTYCTRISGLSFAPVSPRTPRTVVFLRVGNKTVGYIFLIYFYKPIYVYFRINKLPIILTNILSTLYSSHYNVHYRWYYWYSNSNTTCRNIVNYYII